MTDRLDEIRKRWDSGPWSQRADDVSCLLDEIDRLRSDASKVASILLPGSPASMVTVGSVLWMADEVERLRAGATEAKTHLERGYSRKGLLALRHLVGQGDDQFASATHVTAHPRQAD